MGKNEELSISLSANGGIIVWAESDESASGDINTDKLLTFNSLSSLNVFLADHFDKAAL